MAYDGSTWDETNPTNNTLANEIDDVSRDMKIGIRSRLAAEHVWPAVQTGTNGAGGHTVVSFQAQTSTPIMPVYNATTQAGAIYVSSASNMALMFENSAGTVITVVPGNNARSVFPPGTILDSAATAAPSGFYACDGQAYSRTTDSALYSVVGTVYGTGDGSTTFNVPDARGRLLIGANVTYPQGTTGGAATVVLTASNIPALTVTLPTYSPNSGGSANSVQRGAAGPDGSLAVSVDSCSGGAVTIMNPYISVNRYIAR